MIEQRIKTELDRHQAQPGLGDLDSVVSRGHALRRRHALARSGTAVLLVIALAGLGSVFRQTIDERGHVADGQPKRNVVTVGDGLEVQIDETIPSEGSATLLRGVVAPALSFEPEGTEQPLRPREDIELPDDLTWSGDVVYVGTVEGADVFIQPLPTEVRGLSGLIDRYFDGDRELGLELVVWHPVVGYQAVQILGGVGPTGIVGGPLTDPETVRFGDPAEGPSMLAWPATPQGTAAVTLVRDGEPVFWQRPVAGAAVFLVAQGVPIEGMKLVAYDAAGSVIESSD